MRQLLILTVICLLTRGFAQEQPSLITNALPSDEVIQRKITGSWWYSPPDFSFKSRLTLATNGDYLCHLTWKDATNELRGTYRVRDGMFIETVFIQVLKTRTIANMQEPRVLTNHIIRVNDREFVYRDTVNKVVLFRRSKQ